MVAFGDREDFFAVFAQGAFPQEMHPAQTLQKKIQAEALPARDYWPQCLRSPALLYASP